MTRKVPGDALIKLIYRDLSIREIKKILKVSNYFAYYPKKSIIIFNEENPEISQICQKTKEIYIRNPNMHYNLQFCKLSVTCQIKAKHTSAVKW